MFCQNCGNEIPQGAAVCPACGAKVRRAVRPASAEKSNPFAGLLPVGIVDNAKAWFASKDLHGFKLYATIAAACALLFALLAFVGTVPGWLFTIGTAALLFECLNKKGAAKVEMAIVFSIFTLAFLWMDFSNLFRVMSENTRVYCDKYDFCDIFFRVITYGMTAVYWLMIFEVLPKKLSAMILCGGNAVTGLYALVSGFIARNVFLSTYRVAIISGILDELAAYSGVNLPGFGFRYVMYGFAWAAVSAVFVLLTIKPVLNALNLSKRPAAGNDTQEPERY